MNRRNIGDEKEKYAAEYLEKEGYKIIERNFRGKSGEIDIIAETGELLVFVEVKYRRDNRFGYGQESVDKKKCKKIYNTATEYIIKNKLKKQIRFDVIALNGTKIEKYENYFWGDEIGF